MDNIEMQKVIQVFSPHFDDAVLSCGQHILNWQAAGHHVEIITVFTEFDASTLSPDSVNFVEKCGAPSLRAFQAIRAKEDQLAMQTLSVTDYHWLSMTDGGFREDEQAPVY